MKHIYRTYFRLEAPVSDVEKAISYLQEDDMTQYFQRPGLDSVVEKIEWTLTDDDQGYVEVIANRMLTEAECLVISAFISGQNSDGLGEGFEQQDFADCDGDMASFDWRYNDYILAYWGEEED